jgi:DNA-binding NarL/FixJ family response regulator
VKLRVFIADDHTLMREGLKALLSSSSDIEVVAEASEGREAVRLVLSLRPDIVLMDIGLPGLNGIEALRAIRQRGGTACVIMLTMHSDVEHVYRAFGAGADGYLLKEAAGTELLAAIGAIQNGRKYVSRGLGDIDPSVLSGTTQLSPLSALSARERQVLQLVVEGKSSSDIAALVHLSRKTVETYRSRIMKKLGAPDVAALVKFAVKHGITSID